MKPKEYTIGELASAAETTPRTIRYYTAEGLLPAPDTRGKYAVYTDEHLLRLNIIMRLKEAFLPLHEIRTRLDVLSRQQLDQLALELGVQSPEVPEQPTQPTSGASLSAADYLREVIGKPYTTQQRLAEVNESYQPAPSIHAPSAPRAVAPPASAVDRREASSIQPAPSVPPQEPRRGLFEGFRSRRNQAPPAPAATQWQRITLADDVELHIREPHSPEIQAQVEQLLALARDIFGDTYRRSHDS